MNKYTYELIADAVSMQDVLDIYGIENKKGFAFCPFHNEKTPSLKIYEHGFYCFGCGEGGNVIVFLSKLLNISNSEAAMLLNKEFHLGFDCENKPKFRDVMKYENKKKEHAFFQREKENALNILTAWFRYLEFQRRSPLNIDFHLALRDLMKIAYYLDCLARDPADFLSVNIRAVRKIEQELKNRNLQY